MFAHGVEFIGTTWVTVCCTSAQRMDLVVLYRRRYELLPCALADVFRCVPESLFNITDPGMHAGCSYW